MMEAVLPGRGSSLAARLSLLGAEARKRTPGYDPPCWEEVVRMHRPRSTIEVPPSSLMLDVPSPAEVRSATVRSPDYCQRAPRGVGSEAVASMPGGQGEFASLVDFEQGWAPHPDFGGRSFSTIGTTESFAAEGHGTAVLGVLAADGPNVRGLAPRLRKVRLAGEFRKGGGHDKLVGLVEALEVMEPGEVLLVESQGRAAGYFELPLEAEAPFDDVLLLATALRIVVVAAAGNGGHDLDRVTIRGRRISRLPEHRAVFKDTGAWLVGACANGAEDFPECRYGGGCSSCYGSRVDFIAAGEWVETLSVDFYGEPTYRDSFHSTSAASAIVAGAAAIAQSMIVQRTGSPMAPRALRDLLRAHATELRLWGKNQPPAVGFMPDLERFARAL